MLFLLLFVFFVLFFVLQRTILFEYGIRRITFLIAQKVIDQVNHPH